MSGALKLGGRGIRHIKPPAGDCAELLESISLDEIEAMLAVVTPVAQQHKLAPERADLQLFTNWESDFALSVDENYSRKHAAGFHDRPLSGKQLYYLRALYERVARATEAAMIALIEREEKQR